jgi:hypothetical protein
MSSYIKETELYQVYTELNQLMTNYILFLGGDPSVMILYDNIVYMEQLIDKLDEAKRITEQGKGNLLEFFTDENATSINL